MHDGREAAPEGVPGIRSKGFSDLKPLRIAARILKPGARDFGARRLWSKRAAPEHDRTAGAVDDPIRIEAIAVEEDPARRAFWSIPACDLGD